MFEKVEVPQCSVKYYVKHIILIKEINLWTKNFIFLIIFVLKNFILYSYYTLQQCQSNILLLNTLF